MIQPNTITSLSSTSHPSSNDDNINTIYGSSSHQQSQPLKRPRGRSLGSNDRLILPNMINQVNGHGRGPIHINVSNNSDLIETVVQFARRNRVSFDVISALGTISCATLGQPHSQTPAFIAHGPFTLVSFVGTYTNNNLFVTTSSSNIDLRRPFSISFTSNTGQRFTGIVAGKVMAHNNVTVVAIPF
ncbi:hypothetical protein Fmac_006903 [Flemingia macrophylla]|uniref:PPC domain-containing protein n=1 Tax=Flemingia macrophylla TaxID=520843 RepID=A0ABD1NDG3_9FABA